MPQSIADGPLGLEARHRLISPRGFEILMNDVETGVPLVWFKQMPNFYSLPEVELQTVPNTGRIGNFTLPALERGKTFSVVGRLVGNNAQELRQLVQNLRKVTRDRFSDSTWRIEPHPSYGSSAAFWESKGRVVDLDIDDNYEVPLEHRWGPYQIAFTLSFQMEDPRWYWTQEVTGGPNATGFTVNNQGNTAAEPVITQSFNIGAMSIWQPAIYNDTLGKKLELDVPTGSAMSGVVRWDFARRVVEYSATGAAPWTRWNSYFDFYQSNWWDYGVPGLVPGNNILRQVNATNISVSFRHASVA